MLQELESNVKKWRTQLSERSVNWVVAEQLHVTLCFLGSVSTDSVPALISELRGHVKSQPMRLSVEGIGCFPNPKRPRVIWAGVKGEVKELLNLQTTVSQACGRFIEKPDDKPFSPHITLARVKLTNRQESKVISEIVEQEATRRFGTWTLDQICLVRSQLGRKGSKYSIVERFELRGPA